LHELSITQEILEIVTKAVPAGQLGLVREIRLKIGEEGHLLPESLLFCFEALKADFGMPESKMELIRVPVTAECKSCGAVSPIVNQTYQCGSCKGTSLKVLTGNELQVTEILLDD